MFKNLLLYGLFIVLIGCSSAPVKNQPQISQTERGILPVDKNVRIGMFQNGLKYYIRENHEPQNRAELRLVIKAGSILENEDQQGLAHFIEHMAFNGTENFQKNELVDYLESIGMRFGPDLNAYTSFDETVYMLQVPTDSTGITENAFKIMRDWASAVSFDSTEVEKEKGIIVEEWRLGRGAGARLRDKQLPVLLHNSKYVERLPIGQMDVIRNSDYLALKEFYDQWYRPELMAIIAVGDFDSDVIMKLIEDNFASLENPQNLRKREYFEIPDHDSILYSIETDPELNRNNLSVVIKMDVQPEITETDYRQMLVESMYNSILNERLRELLRQENPPFLYASSSKGSLVLTKDAYSLSVSAKSGEMISGLETVLTEAERVRRFGFTQSELERQKLEYLRGIEQSLREKDKTRSSTYASEYMRNFLNKEPIPGLEFEFELYQKFIPEIKLADLNRLSDKWLNFKNAAVLVSAPENEKDNLPVVTDFQELFQRVHSKKILPY